MEQQRTYLAIDLKSFYASVECVDRGLDPLSTHLVVADTSRTEKTICLAVSPALKAHGIGGRARLFEVVQRVREVNNERARAAGRALQGACQDARDLAKSPLAALDYIAATPRMARYIEVSARIYEIYLQFVADKHIHVYSIDEVFIDITEYLAIYNLTPEELARKMIHAVLAETGITATAGIGTNLYLAKVAMDIVAKHISADAHGVRIASLDEERYRRTLWSHTPLTDFWRLGGGIARRLQAMGIHTLGELARVSIEPSPWRLNADRIFQEFGVNAELLMDHAWGWEPCTIADIKAYTSQNHSVSSGQVLHSPYETDKADLAAREMADLLALDLVAKNLRTNALTLAIGYDIENLTRPELRSLYTGPIVQDAYGRQLPKSVHASIALGDYTAASRTLVAAVHQLFAHLVTPGLLVRRLTLVAQNVRSPESLAAEAKEAVYQPDLFLDSPEVTAARERQHALEERDVAVQKALLEIKERFGKNAILRGMNLQEGALARQRNEQIGGHKA